VSFFNYPFVFKEYEDELTALITSVLSRGAYILQQELTTFEANLANYLSVKHAIGVSDGTNALKVALLAADNGPGSEVFVPSHTYVASVAAIHYVGASPVLVECGEDHLIDPARVVAAITPNTRAIMPVQLNGRTADMESLRSIADTNDLIIVEDAAPSSWIQIQRYISRRFWHGGYL